MIKSYGTPLLTLVLLLPLTWPAAATVPADTTGWTPEVAMQYDSITETAMAPDGAHVAYVVREAVMDETTSTYRQQIHVVARDGSSDVQFTRGEHANYSPQWSPDGAHLAFISTRTEQPQVHLIRRDGGEAYAVTSAEVGVNSFAWSPDGEQIAYTMTDPKSEAQEQRERERRDVAVVGTAYRYNHLYVTDVAEAEDENRSVQRLTGGDFHIRNFDWAPDASTLAFAHQPTPDINDGFLQADISTVPADSGAVTSLVDQPGVDDTPQFSPDGEQIAFSSQGGQAEPIGLSDVYVIPATGGTAEKLADTPNRDGSLLGWMDATVLVAEPVGTSSHVIAVPADGSAARQLTQDDGLHSAVSFDADAAHMAFTYENSDTPPEVHVAATETVAKEALTSRHADVPQPPMGRTEVLSWTAPDGLTIEGLLTYPVGYEDGDQVPLVLSVHGGPAGVYNRSFTGGPGIYMTQVFAQAGYAVLRPNPRGSTGYGKEFRYANVEDWGFGDYEDLMAGVDLAIDRGIAHPDSLALMGWSYGGYMTSYAVTKTDRFQAASMGAGLPNLISMVGTTDIPDYLVAHMGGEFWDRYATYERHSAIYQIANVTTPTQVLHGTEDDRVPTAQGQEFYRALKRLDIPTELALYPRTPHGPREPKLLMDVTPRIIAWFDQHLGRTSAADATPDDQ